MQALRPQLLSWSVKVFSFRRNACHYCVDVRRVIFDVLYGGFVQMFWVAANPRDSSKRQKRRPQPDWWDEWDDEYCDQMVSKNVAWRRWCRERPVSRGKSFGPNGLRFIISFVAKNGSISNLAFIVPGRLHLSSANGRWQGVVTIPSRMGARPFIEPCISHASVDPMTGAYVKPCADAPIFSP